MDKLISYLQPGQDELPVPTAALIELHCLFNSYCFLNTQLSLAVSMLKNCSKDVAVNLVKLLEQPLEDIEHSVKELQFYSMS